MKKLIALTLVATLAACGNPSGEDTADLAPDAVEADVSGGDIVGDSSDAPDMATVQLALEEACPTLRNTIRTSTCLAQNLGASFACEFAFETDPEGTERSLTIEQLGEGWTVEQEPRFCESLERANALADQPAADVAIDTLPTE
ncbi:hypothetical protein [Erythrobacter sp.]|uniref:hypothetical protein n=1 Tax=Erythrobacter sp. TaxID=1042 RepID=UPI0025E9D013|nr:hypothetical protein [Erythrobacter sp.]